jgi:hypothetical protein
MQNNGTLNADTAKEVANFIKWGLLGEKFAKANAAQKIAATKRETVQQLANAKPLNRGTEANITTANEENPLLAFAKQRASQ